MSNDFAVGRYCVSLKCLWGTCV